MGRPRKDATTQDVRERLIVAMADRLIREPASAVTVTSLIKEVGCNRSTFYYYFADTEQLAEAIEAGSLPGQWSGEVVVGRPRLADEPLDVISFKVPHSAALAIKRAAEQEGESRSAFLRKAALDRAESVLAAS